eukprot:9295960-Pyramimonas_sp.AAC.1
MGLLQAALVPLHCSGFIWCAELVAESLFALYQLADFNAEGFLPRERKDRAQKWKDWCTEALSGGAKWAHAYTTAAEARRQDLVSTDSGSHTSCLTAQLEEE